jgi:NADH dehydrogenase
VSAPALAEKLAKATGAETDRAGRIKVNPDCTLPGHPEIFAVGDMISLNSLPGVAQVAIQSGRHAAGQIRRRLRGQETGQPFKYFDKGSMATISRFSAVASVGKARFSGLLGWLLWLGVHLLYLVGFKNRVTAVMHWAVSFIGRSRSERSAPVPETLPARHAG